MATTFDSTTEAERELERVNWKTACLLEHVPFLDPAWARALVAGDRRLVPRAPACRVRFALVVACLVESPTDAQPVTCDCPDCKRAA